MPLLEIGSKHQVTIPKETFKKLGLKPGDYLEAQLRNGRIILTPKENDSWFWEKEWQKKEREADEALAKGKYKDFDNVEDLIRDLS